MREVVLYVMMQQRLEADVIDENHPQTTKTDNQGASGGAI